jgi:transposase
MESTGVYWIPIYEMLEAAGLRVFLVNARHFKIVPGRKSDYNDAQWLQRLHALGLLTGSFRPRTRKCASCGPLSALTLIRNPPDGSARILPVTK